MTRLVIRADGGSPIGMGHIVRSLVLAYILKNDFEVAFAVQESEPKVAEAIKEVTSSIINLPKTDDYIVDAGNFIGHLRQDDIVLLDGYYFDTAYQQVIKSKGCKLVSIDDLKQWHQLSDLVINYADRTKITDYSAEPSTRFLLGLNYVLLRKEFINTGKTERKITGVKNILISMGAADIGNLTQKFTEAILRLGGIEEIHLILGSVNTHIGSIERLAEKVKSPLIKLHFNVNAAALKQLIQHCDVAICPASTISLECAAVGIGLITGYTAPNQNGILLTLQEHNAAFNINNLNALTKEDAVELFQKLFFEINAINQIIQNQAKLIDGKSPERIQQFFRKLKDEKLSFRFAVITDAKLYFDWTTDDLVRQNSFNQQKPNWENHLNWFNARINDDKFKFYVFFDKSNEPVGQVRIEEIHQEIVIGISIDINQRGKSYGVEMLEKATSHYLSINPQSVINAYIKKENKSSYIIFKKAGFKNETTVTLHGSECYKMQKMFDSNGD